MNNKIINTILLPVLLLIFSFILRLLALLQTEYGNGWDAYFYLIQIKAILTEGKMHSNDVSFIYPYLLLFKLIIPDYILAYKCAIASISGFYVLSFYFLARELSTDKNNYLPFLLIAAFVLFSPTITYMASQFPKNQLGLVLFNFFLLFWLKNKRWPIILFFILSFFTHRLTAGIICIFVIIQLINQSRFLWIMLIGIALLISSLLLPGLIHFYDIERFKDVFLIHPQFAPLSFIRLIGIEKISYYWMAEMLISMVILTITIISIIYFRKKNRLNFQRFYIILILISFILLFPFYKFDINGPALRFFLSFLCINPIFILFLFEKMNKVVIRAIICILSLASLASFRSYSPEKMDPPYKIYSKISEITTVFLKDKKFDIVVAHKGLAEYFTFTSGIDALPWQPESKYNIDKIWRITSGISNTDFKYYLKEEAIDSIKKVGIDYYLLPETMWQRFIKQIKRNDELNLMGIVYSDKNPYMFRPAYLLKGKK